ncbi:hypothetical protein [Paenibacillus sp. HGF5]|uniref:hypothetical protein n=1 Tax=Paenibacillus sp. HGF5 TaxID=908341 RepID=UPI0002072A28|nr:hypothetical protein [Paenibacillus sp. HGF5]EGG36567.1 conserved domain protein [Paenibacillus sp. HGF5]
MTLERVPLLLIYTPAEHEMVEAWIVHTAPTTVMYMVDNCLWVARVKSQGDHYVWTADAPPVIISQDKGPDAIPDIRAKLANTTALQFLCRDILDTGVDVEFSL